MKVARMRSYGVAALLSLGLLTVGYDSQNALKSEAGDIGASLKTIADGAKTKLAANQPFSFQDPAIQDLIKKLKKLSSDLTSTANRLSQSTQMAGNDPDNSTIATSTTALTDASAKYLSDVSALYQLYAFAAHGPGANVSQFNFDDLSSLNLKLAPSIAQDLVKQQPFNARHSADGQIEFFITSQEKQMAEFFALTSPRDEYTYSKLIQFSALHEGFANLWGIQRLTYGDLKIQPVQNSSPDLLSFKKVPGGDLKQSEAYLDLLALDRYNNLSVQLASAFQATRNLTLLPRGEYYDVLSRALAPTAEFKSYISGFAPQDVSKWMNTAAVQIMTTETANWTGDEKNSENILGSSSMLGDNLTPAETSKRMAEAMFDRRSEAAEAEVLKIATDNIKLTDLSDVQKRTESLLKAYKASWTAQAAPLLLASLSQNAQNSAENEAITSHIQQKTDESLSQAKTFMSALHDQELIKSNFGFHVDSEEDAETAAEAGALLTDVRPEFQLQITDPDTLQSHLLYQAQKAKIWDALDTDEFAAPVFKSFLGYVTADFAQKSKGITDLNTQAKLLLSLAQIDADTSLQSLSGNAISLARLKAVFDQIGLLTAKIPTDLAPTTHQQLDLANLVIEQAYGTNPLLGIRTPANPTATRKLWKTQNPTALERLYRETWKNGQLTTDAHSIIYQSIQAAAVNFQGKLEDFSQADIHNPKDQRFKNLFLSSSHLRTALMNNGDKNHNALVKKFDASLAKKTESMSQLIVNKVINPANTWLFVALIAWTVVAFFCPVAIPAALATFFLFLNMTVFPILTAAQLFFSLNMSFIEQPAQLRYQEALASSQISSRDPFGEWEEQKSKGAITNTIDRGTVDQAHHAMVRSQIINTSIQVANAVWIGRATALVARSNVGATGLEKMRAIFGEQLPGFATRIKSPAVTSFSENLSDEGFAASIKSQAAHVADQSKVLLGVKPVYGGYTSEQALNGLKSALVRKISEGASEDSVSILPEIRSYREFLQARLKTSSAAGELDSEALDLPKTPSVEDESPDPALTTHSPQFWTNTPELKGSLSWKEMIEEPGLRKWMIIPKSAYRALREHRFTEWRHNYGEIVQAINRLRGEFVQNKLAEIQTLETKLELSAQNGESIGTWLNALSSREMALLEECARGPQWLAYGYFSAKSAASQLADTPLKDLVSVFDDYQKMIRSLRPIDYAPVGTFPQAKSVDQEDVRDFYDVTRGRDDINLGSPAPDEADTPKINELEKHIEDELFSKSAS
jgi:hypothetical protein